MNTGLLHEVSGTYPLTKAKASDRVSGSLSLHAYLHMPDAAYVEGIRASAMPWSAPHVQSPPVLPHRRHTVAARTAWAAGESSINNNTDSPAHQEMKGFNPNIDQAQESKDISEWEDGEDDVLELTFAPHSPKIAESPDRRLFKHRPPVFSFGENGPHGPDTKSKIRMRPTTADDTGAEGSSMQHVQSDLVGGSKQLGLNFNDDSDSEEEGYSEDRDEWDPSGLEQFSTNRSAPKGVANRSASSPNTLSYNRKSMLDGVSKCLNGLSVAQDGADCFLEKMQKQLDGRQSAKSLSRGGGGKLSPRRAKSDSNISITKASISDISYPDSSPQRVLTSTPTRNNKERGREKEKENEKVRIEDSSKEKEKEKDKEIERCKENEKNRERAKDSEKSKEKDIEIDKGKGKEKEKEKEKDSGKEVGKYQVYKAVKVAAVSNFMSLSSAPVTTSSPPPAPASRFNADSPFRDVTDYYDDRKASRDDQRIEREDNREGDGDREGDNDDDESGSIDSSEMIVIASTGFTITTSSSGVGYMTSNPSIPPSVSASASASASHSLTPSNPSTQIPSSPPPSISIFASNRSSTESLPMVADQKEKEVVMSEAWRKRNLEREKRSASVSPIRGGGGSSK